MKIEQFITQHFYTAKTLSLQGIGEFFLSEDFIVPEEGDKEHVMPENAISFTYNPKAKEDDKLLNHIVQQTKKIRPLASADLDSYLTLGKQFLNIGKPFKIEGIGILEKKQTGEYQFIQGNFMNPKAELTAQPSVKEKNSEEISFASKAKEKKQFPKPLLVIGGVLLLALLGYGVYYLITRQKDPVLVNKTTNPTPADTIATLAQKDTVAINKDVQSVNPNTLQKDSFSFKVVLKNYPDFASANKSYTRLTSYGHKLLLYTKDSVTYKVAMPFTRPITDSAYARDSIRKKLFGGNPYIEVN